MSDVKIPSRPSSSNQNIEQKIAHLTSNKKTMLILFIIFAIIALVSLALAIGALALGTENRSTIISAGIAHATK